jgi:CheY-like chemotaxis protein
MPTLLIVDDQETVLHTLAYIYRERGWHVVTARSGRDALALATAEPPAVALIDLHMPRMDGIALCRALLAAAPGRHPALRCWLMTAVPSPAAEQAAREAGAEALLKKPFDPAALPDPAGPPPENTRDLAAVAA